MKLKTSFFSRLMRPFLTTGAFAALMLTANAAGYLKIGDIKGESTDDGHREWINLLSVSQGISRAMVTDPTTGQTRRRGDVILEDITCVKELDKASPKLMEACCNGTPIPEVEIVLTRMINDREETYLAYKLTNVLITSYSLGQHPNGSLVVSNIGSSGQDGVTPPATDGTAPGEAPRVSNMTLNFEEIKVIYTAYGKDGAKEGNVEYSWKVEEGTK